MAELFRKKSDVPNDHLLTATVASTFYRGGLSVLYPSVRTQHALNLAATASVFDETFQVLLAEVHRIDKYHGHGIYETTRLRQSTKFAPDGTIDWSQWVTLQVRPGACGTPEPAPGTIGWRVPRAPA